MNQELLNTHYFLNGNDVWEKSRHFHEFAGATTGLQTGGDLLGYGKYLQGGGQMNTDSDTELKLAGRFLQKRFKDLS